MKFIMTVNLILSLYSFRGTFSQNNSVILVEACKGFGLTVENLNSPYSQLK